MKDKLAVFILALTNVVLAIECPKDDGNSTEQIMKHEDCGKFYKCTPDGPITMSCPDGLYFNPETYHCDWKENVYCSEENTSEEKEIESEEEFDAESKEVDYSEMEDSEREDDSKESEIKFQENGCPVNPHIHWLLPDKDDCSVFYYCVHGEKVKQSCPGQLHFNRESKVCDWPDVARCAISSEKNDSEDNDSEVNASEIDSSEDGLSSEESASEPDNSEEDISEKETSEENTSDTDETDTSEVDTPENDSQIDSLLIKKIETAVNVKLLHSLK